MRISQLLCICALLPSTLVQGQQPGFNFGLTAGWHATAITRRPDIERPSPVDAWGANNLHGGAFTEIRLHEPLYLLAEAHFSTFNSRGSYFGLNQSGDLVQQSADLRENAIVLSTLFQYHVNEARACIGFTTMLLQSSTTSANDFDVNTTRNRTDFGLTTGLEVALKPHVSLAARLIRFYGGVYNQRPETAAQARYYVLQLAIRAHIRPIGRKTINTPA